jgi:hypothetical protein
VTKIETKLETYTAEAEVRITYKVGSQVIETWHGVSKRHAVARARDKYRNVARADFASGEPW